MDNCCSDYTRSQLLRSAAADRQGPAEHRDRDAGASRDRPLTAPVPLPQRRPRARRLRRLEDFPLGIPRRASRRPRRPTRSSSRSSSTVASTRSACWRRSATRATRSCGRTLPSAPATAPRSARTPPCSGTRRRPTWRRCTARARSAPSRRSATTTPTSRTSPRATTTRSASWRSASGLPRQHRPISYPRRPHPVGCSGLQHGRRHRRLDERDRRRLCAYGELVASHCPDFLRHCPDHRGRHLRGQQLRRRDD